MPGHKYPNRILGLHCYGSLLTYEAYDAKIQYDAMPIMRTTGNKCNRHHEQLASGVTGNMCKR